MKVAGIEFDRLMQILGMPSGLNRVGLSIARMTGLPPGFQPEMVSRLAGMGLPAGMTKAAALSVLRDPLAAAVAPPSPSRRHCPGCRCFENEEP